MNRLYAVVFLLCSVASSLYAVLFHLLLWIFPASRYLHSLVHRFYFDAQSFHTMYLSIHIIFTADAIRFSICILMLGEDFIAIALERLLI